MGSIVFGEIELEPKILGSLVPMSDPSKWKLYRIAKVTYPNRVFYVALYIIASEKFIGKAGRDRLRLELLLELLKEDQGDIPYEAYRDTALCGGIKEITSMDQVPREDRSHMPYTSYDIDREFTVSGFLLMKIARENELTVGSLINALPRGV